MQICRGGGNYIIYKMKKKNIVKFNALCYSNDAESNAIILFLKKSFKSDSL